MNLLSSRNKPALFLLILGLIVLGLAFLIPGAYLYRVIWGPEVPDPSKILLPRIAMVFVALFLLASGFLLNKIGNPFGKRDPYNLSQYDSSYDYKELYALVEKMSFALLPDRLESINSFLDHGESEIALGIFLSNLSDFDAPVPRAVFERLSTICDEDFPELLELVDFLRPQVVEEDELKPLVEIQKQKIAQELQAASNIKPPVDPLHWEKLRYPQLEIYQQMLQAGATQFEIAKEIRAREQSKLSGMAMLRRLYDMTLEEAKQLWEAASSE